ncbi:IS1182 family transposase [Mucilaginibacter gossypii]|uniref:transposase n=1 Tax=Mucilaginibacter gossypii TaxID=551996 RepID=UPI001AA1C31B|nr:transposase [Mucilaginibacter gossypii]QTE36966.1 IS1182 family transposase [Mucilaginibacter gossypii]WMH62821.1 IS1182 family transposase [Mucilaginibacter gossypii]WMH62861.1 IS1182 family transposase [Mucilaginibacter gossypii]WMH62880.1 IS1182 family transposase [Mucilaginibacter gossypii]
MQGKKHYQEKLFTNFQLSDRVPADNIYRKLKETLDLQFLYASTAKYYGKDGQKSIDPVVFFKLLLVGYLENQPSDRRIINISSMRLDILYFIGYDIDEELPWHSTLSRTRQLYDEDIFNQLFKQVLKQCIDKGMLTGKRQAVDSVFVKANASMSSVEDILEDGQVFTDQLKEGQATEGDDHLSDKSGRQKTQKRSNANRASTTDPDARMSVKPGKVTKLNYLSQLSVDTSSYVITSIGACHADKKDNQCLDTVLDKVCVNLGDHGLEVKEVIADANYSSSTVLQSLVSRGITGYIPNTGTYKSERQGFTYNAENDTYQCSQGNSLKFIGYKDHHGVSKEYMSKRSDCAVCSVRKQCLKKSTYKTITNSLSKPLFDDMHKRLNEAYGKQMMVIRKSTVEPVIGTLVEYLGMRKVNTIGIELANKCMLMAGIAYNLKKLIKYEGKSFLQVIMSLLEAFKSSRFYYT